MTIDYGIQWSSGWESWGWTREAALQFLKRFEEDPGFEPRPVHAIRRRVGPTRRIGEGDE